MVQTCPTARLPVVVQVLPWEEAGRGRREEGRGRKEGREQEGGEVMAETLGRGY